MKRQLKGLLYFSLADLKFSFLIFWIILFVFLTVGIGAAYLLLNVEHGKMYFSLSSPVYIFCSILGYKTVKEMIPFSIKIGATRKNIFISTGVLFLILAVACSILTNTLHASVLWIMKQLSIDTFHFVHPAQLLTDVWTTRVVMDTAIIFFLTAFLFLIGLLFYNYGLIGGGSTIALLVLVLLIGVAKGWIADFFVNLYKTIDLAFFYQMLFVGVIFYGISWLFLRRIIVK